MTRANDTNIGVLIAAQITGIRKARGWNKKELAAAAGMNQARISLLEKPDYGMHTIATLQRIAGALEVDLFVGFIPKKRTSQ